VKEEDLGKREELRKENKEEGEYADAAKESQEKYKHAMKKAKKISAETYSSNNDYDEIEAAINRQVLAMKAPETKNIEDVVHDIIEQNGAEAKKEENSENTEKGSNETLLLTDTANFIHAVPSVKDRKDYRKR